MTPDTLQGKNEAADRDPALTTDPNNHQHSPEKPADASPLSCSLIVTTEQTEPEMILTVVIDEGLNEGINALDRRVTPALVAELLAARDRRRVVAE